MWLFVILVAVPIIEIALFIQVGGWIGTWPTLAIVVCTALVGTLLLRSQGMATMQNLQQSVQTGQNPVTPIAHGAIILISGVLLLTPGFFTDALGLTLLVPPVRAALIKAGAARIAGKTVVFSSDGPPPAQEPRPEDGTIDGEFTVEDDEDASPGNSGWTRPQG